MTTYEDMKQIAEGEGRRLTPDETRDLWARIHAEAFDPHAELIARIAASGDIVVVTWDLHPTVISGARTIGYDGVTPVFRLSNKKRKLLVDEFKRMGDTVSAQWFGRTAGPRIYLMAQLGTFLLNLTDNGIQVEPGSMDGVEADEASLRATIAEWGKKN